MNTPGNQHSGDTLPQDAPYLLLIDDDQMVLDILKEVLQSTKIGIISARSGEEALHTFNRYQHKIKLVLLDLFLPDINGIEIYKKIIKSSPEIKVIFMSGFPDQDILKLKDLPGDFDFIQKPFSLQDLKSRVQNIIN
jgi:DNA-binding NtrC family response regulator